MLPTFSDIAGDPLTCEALRPKAKLGPDAGPSGSYPGTSNRTDIGYLRPGSAWLSMHVFVSVNYINTGGLGTVSSSETKRLIRYAVSMTEALIYGAAAAVCVSFGIPFLLPRGEPAMFVPQGFPGPSGDARYMHWKNLERSRYNGSRFFC